MADCYRATFLLTRMNSYETYSLTDFLDDAYFLTSITQPTAETSRFWTDWLARHPAQRPVWEQARRTALALDAGKSAYETPTLSESQTDALWNRIQRSVQPQSVFVAVHRREPGRRWLAVAAVVATLLLAGFGAYFWLRTPRQTEIHTAYGQTQRLRLPDGSTVTLNANSTLRYAADWQPGTERQVTLDGEAFFEVTHLHSNARFVVHTGKLDVEVLGTKFNVNTRRERTRVTLKEGRVKVDDLADHQSLVMKPGETVEWSARQPTLTKKQVRPERYAAWTEKRLVFENTPLPEVAQMLEDQFGLHVKIENPALLTKTLSGEIALENEELLLQALRDLYGLRISREGNAVSLR